MSDELPILERTRLELEVDKLKLEISDLRKTPLRRFGDWTKEVFNGTVILLSIIAGLLTANQAREELGKAKEELGEAKTELTKVQAESKTAQADAADKLKALTDKQAVLAAENETQSGSLKKTKSALDEMHAQLAGRSTELDDKRSQLAQLQGQIQALQAKATPELAAQLSELAVQAQQASARMVVEVLQNSRQALPEPLLGYAISVGSVGSSNAERIVIFQLPTGVSPGPGAPEIEPPPLGSGVVEVVKIRTGGKFEFLAGGKKYQATATLLPRKGKDSIQFAIEPKD